MHNAQDILKFWFADHGPDDWFAGKPEFDAEIADRFTETHAAVARGEAWRWRATPAGRLAEIIVLDQFSRQLHRASARAFSTDGMALVLAQEAVALGADQTLEGPQRSFLYMPYMHSESAVIHVEAERLFEALGDPDTLDYEHKHAEAIRRFGRYPSRSKALGRETTAEERAYLEAGGRF